MSAAPEKLRSALLGHVPHGFLGRRGGISDGIYAGLNVGLGSNDARDAVLENRDIARDVVLPGADLVTVHQVHSADVVTVTEPIAEDARPRADAMVTDRPGLLLGILTADCVPVLFHDAQARVIGAAHAGWKGALGGVTDAVLDAMEALGAERDAHRLRDRAVHCAEKLRSWPRFCRAFHRCRRRQCALFRARPAGARAV